jgi:hypothetical protein
MKTKKQLIQNIQGIESKSIQLYKSFIKDVPDDSNNLFRVCNSLCKRIDEIKKGIYTLYISENIYSSKILIRCLIEHYYRLFLITTKGKQYAEYYDNHLLYQEVYEYCKSEKFVQTNLNKATSEYSIEENMENNEKGSTKILRKERDEINALFRYKAIWKSLIPEMKKSAELFSKIIIEYSKLSSYIHGGPYAGVINLAYSMDKAIQEITMKDILKSAITLNIGAKMYLSFTIDNIDKEVICKSFEEIERKMISKIEEF